MNKKGVFGLESVKVFFAIILGIALLAYVIVVIMGTLNTTTILTSPSGAIINESAVPTDAGGALAANVNPNCLATVTQALNGSNGTVIPTSNYSYWGCRLVNLTTKWTAWNVSYTYTYDSQAQVNSKVILANTSSGVTGFFSNVNPVYAILAILVIILVLVVLVRVVSGGGGPGGRYVEPQL